MIKKVYVVTTKGRTRGKLYQHLPNAKSYAKNLNQISDYWKPVHIRVLKCEHVADINISDGETLSE